VETSSLCSKLVNWSIASATIDLPKWKVAPRVLQGPTLVSPCGARLV